MDWNAVTLLRTNINTLSLSIARNVKKTYPTRTTEFKKCTRDLAYILQATSTSIQANNTLAIDHIIKKSGTPTMGGLLILSTLIASTLLTLLLCSAFSIVCF